MLTASVLVLCVQLCLYIAYSCACTLRAAVLTAVLTAALVATPLIFTRTLCNTPVTLLRHSSMLILHITYQGKSLRLRAILA